MPSFAQITLQDLPDVPASIQSPEDQNEKLDLPDVPSKAPVVPEVVADDAQVATKRKGLSLSLSLSLYHLNRDVYYYMFLYLENANDWFFWFYGNSHGGTIASLIGKVRN